MAAAVMGLQVWYKTYYLFIVLFDAFSCCIQFDSHGVGGFSLSGITLRQRKGLID